MECEHNLFAGAMCNECGMSIYDYIKELEEAVQLFIDGVDPMREYDDDSKDYNIWLKWHKRLYPDNY